MHEPTLTEGLKAAGLKPIIIDEDFDFTTLPPLHELLGIKPAQD